MQTRTLQFRFLVVAVFVFLSATVFAQDAATLTGTVRDHTGAVIPNASVALKNTATGTARDVKTNADGEYVAAALQPGQYNLTVIVTGFRKYQANGSSFAWRRTPASTLRYRLETHIRKSPCTAKAWPRWTPSHRNSGALSLERS